jgi:PAS domain S-box-containing protein
MAEIELNKHNRFGGTRFLSYGVALLTVAVALGISLALGPLIRPTPTSLFFVAVMVTAWYGGLRPGLVATVLSTLAINYWFLPPSYSLNIATPTGLICLTVFALAALLISRLNASRPQAMRDEQRLRLISEAAQYEAEVAKEHLIEQARVLQQQANLLELSSEAIFVRNQQGVITYWNRGAEVTYGWTREEAIGQVSHTLLQTQPVELASYMDQQLLKREYWQGELTHICKAGQSIIVDSRQLLIRDPQGNPSGFLEVNRDITERKQTEAALRESQTLFEAFMRYSPATAYIKDEEGRYLYVNPLNEQVCNLSLADMLGKTDFELFPHSDAQQWRDHDRAVLAAGEALEVEEIFSLADGDHHFISFKFPIPQPSGRLLLGGISLDVTERKRTEQALAIAMERFELAANAVNCLVYEWHIEQNTVERTEGLTRLLGYAADEADASADWWFNLYHPEDRPRIQTEIAQAWATCDRFSLEYRVRHKNGHYVYLLDQAIVVQRDTDGKPLRLIGSTIDISDRKRAEAALRESERRFRRLVESNMFGVAFGDFTGRFHYANDYFVKMVGYSREEIESGQVRWMDITPAEFLPLDERAGVELRTRGVATQFEKEYLRKDGTRVPILIGSALLHEPHSRSQEIITFYVDLTTQRQVQAELARSLAAEQAARADAETANRIKDEFLAVLSHELRSPLNPILGWTKLLQKQIFTPEETVQALATIERNAKLQSQLIEDLLDVSRILRGKMALTICPVNLVNTIEAAIETVRLAAEAKNIRIHTHLDAAVGHVSGDPARLQQIIWNLLTNAVKFTPQGGQVEVRLIQVDSIAQIQVQDTGKGISPDFLPHVFDYFRQEDGAITRKFGGLGLGLAIVRHLTEQHGGTIIVESAGENQGATFTVCFPLQFNAVVATEEDSPPSQVLNLSALKILVVDDEADMRELMRMILTTYRAQVLVAASAIEALNLLESWQPDLLISDIGMPEIDGYMLLRQVRRLSPEQGGQIPAIALTAYAGEYDQQQALASGFQQHISKPVEPEQLVEAIVTLIGERLQ